MAISIEKISKELEIPEDQLIKYGLKAFLEKELILTKEDISILQERYRVKEIKELEEKIKKKEIPSHPAWEDIIQWENILKQKNKLDSLLGTLV